MIVACSMIIVWKIVHIITSRTSYKLKFTTVSENSNVSTLKTSRVFGCSCFYSYKMWRWLLGFYLIVFDAIYRWILWKEEPGSSMKGVVTITLRSLCSRRKTAVAVRLWAGRSKLIVLTSPYWLILVTGSAA